MNIKKITNLMKTSISKEFKHSTLFKKINKREAILVTLVFGLGIWLEVKPLIIAVIIFSIAIFLKDEPEN